MLSNTSAAIALGAALTLTLAACSDNDPASTGSGQGNASNPAAEPSPVAEIDTLTGRQTAVTLDPGFVEDTKGLGLTLGTVGNGLFDGTTGRVAFPITGGNMTYFSPDSGVDPYVQGAIRHDGSGLSVSARGGPTVELTDFVIDPEQSVLTGTVTADGELAAEDAPLFFLDGSTLNPLEINRDEGTAVLEGTTVSLTAEAAELLNMSFGVDALAEFFPVGVAEITFSSPA
jgi:hypothetical protein